MKIIIYSDSIGRHVSNVIKFNIAKKIVVCGNVLNKIISYFFRF